MCYIPDLPTLSPLPTVEIPPEPPIVEPQLDDIPDFGILPRRVDEDGREYYPHPLYAFIDVVPVNMRDYINSDDDDDEDMRSFLDGYNQFDEDEQMSNHEDDYETEEEELVGEDEAHSAEEEEMEEDEEELVPTEDEEQEQYYQTTL